MQDAGFSEYFAVRCKSVLDVEPQSMGLGMQADRVAALLPGAGNQPFEDRTANPPAPPLTDHCNTADMSVGQQAPGADRASIRIDRQRVHGCGIGVIPFQFFGNLLLDDEHPAAQVLQRDEVLVPGSSADGEFLRWGHVLIIVSAAAAGKSGAGRRPIYQIVRPPLTSMTAPLM